MRRPTICILVVLASVLCSAKDESLDELKQRAEATRPEDRVGVCLKIAHMQLRNADKLYEEGKVEQARGAVDDIVTYSDKAGAAATQAKKHQKNVEIGVRKLAEKLQDIKHSLALEDQPPLEGAIQRLEQIRTAMLKEMFSKEKK